MQDNSTLLFLVPEFAGGKGLENRLLGVRYIRSDRFLNFILKEEHLRCALPMHAIPSPAYLMRQHLHPNALRLGLNEREFCEALDKLFCEPNLTLITWSAQRLSEALDAAAIRSMTPPNLLSKVPHVIELKNLNYLCTFFSETKLPGLPALSANVKALKLKLPDTAPNRTPKSESLLELAALFSFLERLEPKMLSFASKSTPEKILTLDRALNEKKPLVLLSSQGRLKIILITNQFTGHPGINPHTLYFEAAAYDIKERGYERIFIDPLNFETAAPLVILTPKRLASLELNAELLEQILSRLTDLAAAGEDANPEIEDKRVLPLSAAFVQRLTTFDLKWLEERLAQKPRTFTNAPLEASAFLRQLTFLFRAVNNPGSLIEQELERYRSFTIKRLEKAIPKYLEDLKLMAGNLDEKDEAGQKLVHELAEFISHLD